VATGRGSYDSDGGVVRDYLLDHARNKPGGKLAQIENGTPWVVTESRLLSDVDYPLNKNNPLTGDAKAWMSVLKDVPHDPVRDWMMLLCGVASCRTLEGLSSAILVDGHAHVMVKTGHFNVVNRDYAGEWYIDDNCPRLGIGYRNGRLEAWCYYSKHLRGGTGWPDGGPMRAYWAHHERPLCALHVVTLAMQLGIDPPPRVAPPAPPARR
jgi:hypothetical protein